MKNLVKTAVSVLCIGVLSLFSPKSTFAQRVQNNAELQKMADEDQQSRMNGVVDWKMLNQQDSLRRVRIFQLIKEKKVQTAQDHFNAGIVFQHGNDTIASGIAVSSFDTALRMDSTLNRWWYAAAVDRDLMRKKQPQIYGTQFIKDKEGKWSLYQIDTTKVSDEQRAYYSIETLAAQQEKARLMNLKSISNTYKENKSIPKTIELIRELHRKGRLPSYSLEAEVNKFGHELLTTGKKSEALKIFKLNVELYPTSDQAIDNYERCLLQLGEKK